MMRSSVNPVSRAAREANHKPLIWGFNVSEGGLGHRSWCCITDSVMSHQSKLTRHGTAGPAFRRRHAAAAPACRVGPDV
jgi:hypothetical protein